MTGIGEALGSGHPYTRAKFIRGWQDSCAVHDLGASDGENAPWRQDVRAVHSPTALCGAFWMHGAHILPKLAVFECMQAICCHEPVFFSSGAPFGNASGRYLATADSLGTHRDDILPWPGRGGVHGAAHVANGAESAGRVKAELQAGAELRGAGGTARRQALGIGIPSARVAGVAEWRDFHTRTKGRGPHRRPRNKRRREHCSPSFVVRFTTQMTLGTCTATSRRPSAFFPTEDCTRQQVCTHAKRADRQSAREDPRAH